MPPIGTLELDARGCIPCFREKADIGPQWINGGVYVLEPEILDFIPCSRVVSIEEKTSPLILERRRHLFCCPVEGFFVDIDTPEGYSRFCQYAEGQAQ